MAPTREVKALDPLVLYMKEVARYPLLSREEEMELVEKMRKENDIEAAKLLVSSNLRLVAKIAFEYRNSYHNVLDLIQEGNVGLMKAVSLYDPDKGARLSYYASWWIKSYILKFILDNFRLVRMGTTQTQRKLFYNLMREKEKIEAQGYYAGPKLLSEKLGVSQKEVEEMDRRLTSPEISLDAPTKSDASGDRILDFLEGDASNRPDEKFESKDLENTLHNLFKKFSGTLNERDREIFQKRLLAEFPKTLEELAQVYGISKERTRQLESKILKKLREFLKEFDIDISVLSNNN